MLPPLKLIVLFPTPTAHLGADTKHEVSAKKIYFQHKCTFSEILQTKPQQEFKEIIAKFSTYWRNRLNAGPEHQMDYTLWKKVSFALGALTNPSKQNDKTKMYFPSRPNQPTINHNKTPTFFFSLLPLIKDPETKSSLILEINCTAQNS